MTRIIIIIIISILYVLCETRDGAEETAEQRAYNTTRRKQMAVYWRMNIMAARHMTTTLIFSACWIRHNG